MDLKAHLTKFQLEKISINAKFLQADFKFETEDQDAAWELYVEMLTRIVTQPLPRDVGDDQSALESVYSLFPTTREILRRRGRVTIQFSKIAIPVLNQVVRPFTAKWHRQSIGGAFDDPEKQTEFRNELAELQRDLRNYNRLLADLSRVEDLTDLEKQD